MITYLFVGLGTLTMIAFLFFRDKKSSPLAICLKTLTSILFIVTALVAVMNNEGKFDVAKKTFIILMVVGLLFGLFGDFTLDFKVYFKSLRYPNNMKDSDFVTYIGMGAFAVGHILYITGVLILNPNHLMNLLYSSLGAVAASCLIVFGAGKMSHLHFGKFLIPSLLYCFLLTNFGIISLIVMIDKMTIANILRFVGSMFFLISDLILSFTYFSEKDKYLSKNPLINPESRLYIIANHGTYYAAQFILAVMLMFI